MAASFQVVDVTALLLGGQSPDAATRHAAEEQLRQAEANSFPSYIASLSAELANNTKPVDSRRLAGLMLKNALDAKEDLRKRELHARWVQLDPTLRQHVRDALLATLHAEATDVRHTAAMVVAKVSSIDLPRAEWPSLIQALLANMGAQPPNTGTRQATLQAMGYVLEEMGQLNKEVLTPQEVNMVLTAVVAGMGPTEPNDSRLAATIALSNAIEFAHHNFENDTERNYLMQVVCQGTQSTEQQIRVASFECLHDIAALYYSKLPAYMTELYNITMRAIKEDQEEVSLQAIEFWSTVCEYEIELLADIEDGNDPSEPCHNFIKAAAQHLVPVFLELLTKQEEGQEQDETGWNVSMAAATCLELMARCIQNELVPMVMPFIQANISKNTATEDWRFREAATLAFGVILDGPEPSKFTDTVKQALGFLLQAMRDAHPYVRDSTAWTIGRIFEFLHANDIEPSLITAETLPPIIAALVEGLKDRPHVAYRVCGAISALAQGFGASAPTSPMSPFFKDTIAALLHCAQRPDGHENARLPTASYEAINDLVRTASGDTLDTVAQLITVILPEIHKTMEVATASSDARDRQAEVQGQLCGVLTTIMDKLSKDDTTKARVLPYADQVMETLLKVFGYRSATVHEEAMLAVGTFSYAMGKNFVKYLQSFYPYLKMGLTNYQEWQVCLSTVGVLGDVCRNVEDAILPVCDEIMSILIQNLGREDVHRMIKPQILSSFGDIALVIADKYEKYLEAVLRVLKQAMQLSMHQAQSGDQDYVDYNNELRRGIMDAYSGILQGMGSPKCEQYLRGEIGDVVAFVASIGHGENEIDEEVARAGLNLLGDLCSVMQANISVIGGALKQHQANVSKLTDLFKEQTSESDMEWALNQLNHAISRA